jgi:hypothetical protein
MIVKRSELKRSSMLCCLSSGNTLQAPSTRRRACVASRVRSTLAVLTSLTEHGSSIYLRASSSSPYRTDTLFTWKILLLTLQNTQTVDLASYFWSTPSSPPPPPPLSKPLPPTMSQPSAAPRLTPQFCFNQTALRGSSSPKSTYQLTN